MRALVEINARNRKKIETKRLLMRSRLQKKNMEFKNVFAP